MWPFRRRWIGPCVACRWHEPGAIKDSHRCTNPDCVVMLSPIRGGPVLCDVARCNGLIEGPCAGGRFFEPKGDGTDHA